MTPAPPPEPGSSFVRDPKKLADRLQCVERILTALNRRCGNRLGEHDLADTIQDTVVITIRKIATYREGTAFESWVFRIAYLEYQNALRRTGRQHASLLEIEKEPGSDENSLGFEELYRALERLEDAEAQIVRLKYLEGATFEEISERLDIPLGTAKTRHYRGMSRLQRYLRGRNTEVSHG